MNGESNGEILHVRKELAQRYKQARLQQLSEAGTQTEGNSSRDVGVQTDPIRENRPVHHHNRNARRRVEELPTNPTGGLLSFIRRHLPPPPPSPPRELHHYLLLQQLLGPSRGFYQPPVEMDVDILDLLPTFTFTAVLNRSMEEDVPVPVPPEVLSQMPVTVYKKIDDDSKTCAICLQNFAEGEKIRHIPICFHEYHQSCIDQWFSQHVTCPICKRDVRERS